MSYIVKNTNNGGIILTILDGTADGPDFNPGINATDLDLFGKNFPAYGQDLNQNFISLLQNFASTTPPSKPLIGELWYNLNPQQQFLNVYNGSEWVPVDPITVSATAPTTTLVGSQWWDTTNLQLNSWNGSSWTLIGPAYKAPDGKSGAIVEDILDTVGGTHTVIKFYHNNNVIAITSYDAQFTISPANPVTGFNIINPGLTLTTVDNALIYGTATNTQQLGNVVAANYARTDIVPTFTSNILVGNGNIIIDSSSNGTARFYNTVLNANLSLHVNVGGRATAAVKILGTDNSTTIYGNLTLGNSITAYGVQSTGATGTQNLVFSNSPNLTGILSAQNGAFSGSLSSTGSFTVNTNKFTVNATNGDIATAGNLLVTGHSTLEGVTSTGATGTGALVFNTSPVLYGVPSAPTPSARDISGNIATTAFVNTAIATSSLGLWQGSQKFVSSSFPSSGQGNVGDFWFQI
jgi:hypothetical protein